MRMADSTAVFDRGQDYFCNGMVSHVSYTGNRLSARVTGNRIYEVDIRQTGEGLDCRCDCPYDGDICKHIVAVLLEFLAHKEELAAQAAKYQTSWSCAFTATSWAMKQDT